MTNDLVKRLRSRIEYKWGHLDEYNQVEWEDKDALEAADEIEQLEGEIERLRVTALGLWDLLDEIDTISDLVKDNDKLYRQLVEKVQRRRFTFASTDGYSVLFARSALSTPAKGDKP